VRGSVVLVAPQGVCIVESKWDAWPIRPSYPYMYPSKKSIHTPIFHAPP
jgi:hypothetical protein